MFHSVTPAFLYLKPVLYSRRSMLRQWPIISAVSLVGTGRQAVACMTCDGASGLNRSVRAYSVTDEQSDFCLRSRAAESDA